MNQEILTGQLNSAQQTTCQLSRVSHLQGNQNTRGWERQFIAGATELFIVKSRNSRS